MALITGARRCVCAWLVFLPLFFVGCQSDEQPSCAAPRDRFELIRAIEQRMVQQQRPSRRGCTSLPVEQLVDDAAFYAHVLRPALPVVIRGGLKQLGKLNKWKNLSYLEDRFGDTVHTVHHAFADSYVTPKANGVLEFPFTSESTLRAFLKAANQSNQSIPASDQPRRYIEQSALFDDGSVKQKKMMKDVPLPPFAKFLAKSLEAVNLWIGTTVEGEQGNKPKQTSLHFDPFDNLMVPLLGSKEFVMFDPSDSHRLYPQWLADYSRVKPGVDNPELISGSAKSDNFSPVMLEHIDTARFPLFDKQRAIRCTIQPGDILFVPAYTWHHVYSWTDKQAGVNAGVNYWFKTTSSLGHYHDLIHEILVEGNTKRQQ